MWFKNLHVFTITQPLSFDEEQVEQQLASNRFQPCSSQTMSSQGWASPIPNGEILLHCANGIYLMCLKVEEKILPSSVINAQLEQKVVELEAEKQSPLSKADKKELKENITATLLPRAFSKFSKIYGFVAPSKGLVVVDSSSDSKTELFLATLRKSIESLPVLPLGTQSIAAQLTDWIKTACPSPWELNDEAELVESGEDAGQIKCKRLDLTDDEILGHIDAGKMVSKLSVSWKERLNLLIQDNLQIKRIKYSDFLLEQNEDIPRDQKQAKFDADFVLMAAEVIELVEDLTSTFLSSEA
jgi:recombination associated protein RdgC